MGHAQTTVTWNGSTDMTWTQPDSTSWSGATYESGDTAVFAGSGAGTVTIQAGGVTPGRTNVTANNYTFSGGPLGGSGGIAKSGGGTLTLTGSNTYSGTTSITGGVLNIQHASALGDASAGTTVSNDAALHIQGGITVSGESLVLAGQGFTTPGAFRNVSGSNTWTGNIAVNEVFPTTNAVPSNFVRVASDSGNLLISGNVTLAAGGSGSAATIGVQGNGSGEISGNISGGLAGALTFFRSGVGTGMWTLSGTNTYLGYTQVSGPLTVRNGAAIPDTSLVYFSASSGSLTLASSETIGSLISGSGATSASINLGANTLTIGADNTTPVDPFAGGAAGSYWGVITGSGGITKIGAGTLTLSGSNSYTGGTQIDAGVLTLGNANALSSTGTISFGGGTLRFSSSNTTDYSSRFSAAAAQAYRFDTNGNFVTLASPLTSSSGSLTKLGTGRLTLSGSNSYTGGTQIDAGVLALENANALGSTGTISFGGGMLRFSASNTTDYSSRFSTAAAQAYSFETNGQGVTLASPLTSSSGSLTKAGAGVLILSGSVANTYTGTTNVSAGELRLSKTAGVTAVGGDLVITGAGVTFVADNQIADTATVVVSGGGTLNGIGFNTGQRTIVEETIGSLAVNGGNFNGSSNPSSAWGWTVTGTGSFTGGEGVNNTRALFYSGGNNRFGGLSLTNMTGTAGLDSTAANAFTVYGASSTRSTGLFVGSGGLTLDNSVLNLRRGGSGSLGSRLILDGDVTVTGTGASRIAEDTAGGSVGIRDVQLSSTTGNHVRTFTTGGGGADLSVLVPITNGSATTGGIRKLGLGTLTLGTANTYSGTTTISAGVLALGAGGSFATSPTITVGDTGSSGAVLDLTAKTGTFTFTSSQTVRGIGTIKPGTAEFAGILAPGNSAGILTFDGGTALLSGTTQIEILGASRGTGYDGIDLINSAAIDYGGGVLALDFGSWLADQQSYQLFGSGSSSLLGDFSSVTIVGTNYTGLTFTGSNGVWTSQGTSPANQTLTFTEATGTLVIVPEPGALLLAGLGIAVAWALRRRK